MQKVLKTIDQMRPGATISPKAEELRKPEKELFSVRFSVPAIFVTISLAVGVILYEAIRDLSLASSSALKPETGPNFVDQIANNAILLASTAVSGFLVVLTYSLFRKTGEALTIAREQSLTADAQALSATRQAATSESSLTLLQRQFERESIFEARRNNPFLDLDPDGITYHAFERKVCRLIEDDHGHRLDQIDVVSWDSAAEEAAQNGQSDGETLFYGLSDFSVRLPIRNKGQGSAINVSVVVEPISWANVRPKYVRTEKSEYHSLEAKVVFDRMARVNFGAINATQSAKNTFVNLLLGPDKTWEIDVTVPMFDTLPLSFEAHPVLDDEQVMESATFDSDLLFGRVEVGTSVRFEPQNGKIDRTDGNAFRADSEHVERYAELYSFQRRFPIGIRVTISYASVNAEQTSDSSDVDAICYVILFRDSAVPNQPSRLRWDVELVKLRNAVLHINRAVTNETSRGPGTLRLASIGEEQKAASNVRKIPSIAAKLEAGADLRRAVSRVASSDDIYAVWSELRMSPCLLDSLSQADLTAAYEEMLEAIDGWDKSHAGLS